MNFSRLSQWFRQEKNTVPKRQLTFRIRGVPNNWDRNTLQSFLTEGDRIAEPVIYSLAKEFHGRSQTATVSFRNNCQPPSKFSLPAASSQHGERGSLVLDHDFLSITSLFTPPQQDHKVDIIAISSLGGHAFGSFRERGGEHKWLRDALPYDITSDSGERIARIMVYGYDSSLPNSDSFQNLEDLGTTLHSDLRTLKLDGSFKPIVFIAHSLGGLIVKQLLISLSKSIDDVDQRLRGAIYGIAFFGVPHDGMDIRSLIPMAGDRPNRFLLESIGYDNSQILSIQKREFAEALGGRGEFEIISFYETRLSPTALQDDKSGTWTMSGEPAVLVSKASATHCRLWEDGPEHICAINRSHSEMVKFSQEDSEYEKVLGRIRSLTQRAIITRRKPISPHLSPEEQICLHSLAFRQMQDRDNEIEHAVKGTCEWLLKHETYINWATSNKSLLWIKGKPGAGKSTLLKYALGKQRDMPSAGGNDVVMSFFFHARGDNLQKTPLGFLRSILHQILKQAPEALSDLVSAYEQKCKDMGDPPKKWQWHLAELWDFFESSLPRILTNRSIWLFVDALDECGENDAKDIVQRFTWILEKLPPHPAWIHIHICFTCRHYPILSPRGLLEICLEIENKNDISTYVQSELKLSSFKEPTPSVIQNLIITRASGIFLWAQLVIKKARDLELDGAGSNEIEKAIRSIPEGLHQLYKELIGDMGPSSLKLIQWVCFALRPLSTEELRWALVIDARFSSLLECQKSDNYIPDSQRMNQRLIKLSRGLVEVTSVSKTEVVQFIHQSVKDFFTNEGLLALDNTSSSKTCICYLKMVEINQKISHEISHSENFFGFRHKSDLAFPFLDYATTSWVSHSRQSNSMNIPQEAILKLFAWPSNAIIDTWVHVFKGSNPHSLHRPPAKTTLVHIAARYGMVRTLAAILENETSRTPLLWAAKERDEAIVRLLLVAGAQVETPDSANLTPLSWAASNGHEGIVRLLLDAGAQVDWEDSWIPSSYHEKRHSYRPWPAEHGQTPLLWAAMKGHEAIVRLLLGAGAQVNSVGRYRLTSLSWAARNGHETVAKLLLDAGAQVDWKDGWTPMLYIREMRWFFYDFCEPEGNGQTPLIWSAMNGHEAVTRLLLDAKAQVDSRGRLDERMALSWAAENGYEGIVKLLLAAGAQVDAKSCVGRTPLLHAARKGHKAVARLLLDAGADMDAGGNPDDWKRQTVDVDTPRSYVKNMGL
ncbi:ankyrin repeat-containing domain protein [Trichoderma afarasin]